MTDYLRRPDTLDAQAAAHLRSLTREYPYFHAARVLLLQALYKQHAPEYDEELRRSAALVPDRAAIFQLTERPRYTRSEEHRKFRPEGAADRSGRTEDLIHEFLESQPAQAPADSRPGRPVDSSQDYIGYLLQTEEAGQDYEDVPMDGVVETFLSQEPARIVLSEPEEGAGGGDRQEQAQDGPKSEILTEIMAGIYIRQGKYENALKIIRQLAAKYPGKSRYFADQMRFLEKLIINNKHK